MEAVNTALLIGALLLFVSVAASVASSRFGFPLLLVFLGVGLVALACTLALLGYAAVQLAWRAWVVSAWRSRARRRTRRA